MPFDYAELMKELFPAPKPGEWVPVEYGLPKEFDMVVFAIDDGSTEGMLYMGYREGDSFRVMYQEADVDPFKIGGADGVVFWTLVPDSRSLFANVATH